MVKLYDNIRQLIEDASVKHGKRLAFKIKKQRKIYDDITYLRLREEMESMGKYLISQNLAGKRVAVIGKNSYQWMLVYLSVLATGGIIVPLDRGLFPEEIHEQLTRSGAQAIFYGDEFEETLSSRDDTFKMCIDSEDFEGAIEIGKTLDNKTYKNIKVDGSELSILLFTSGTTAASKAVMLTQKNITANVYGMTVWENFDKNDVNMALLPFHHTFGMTQIVLFLSVGMCNVFCEGLRIARCLLEYNVTVLVGVPRIIEEIHNTVNKKLKSQNKLEKVSRGIQISNALRKFGIDIRRKLFKELLDAMGGLRMVIVGAAPADPEVLKWFNDIGVLTVLGYGLTETAPTLTAESYKCMRRGSVGKALPNVELKIDTPDENGIGEIIAKGDNVMLGYYNDEESTNAVLKNGWFYTGDMGYFDSDGYLYITGRKKNVIVLNNGKNVFPEELESLISSSEYIKECLVYNDTESGKDCITAKIVYNADYTVEEIRRRVKDHIDKINTRLASYKQIKDYFLTEIEMEKTTTLKIKRWNTVSKTTV
ncbi:MAG: AMP-binding protein [Eubacteriales bacterium]|nr:AMP-binding protein [Eubacteriales bacterium]